MKKLLIILFLPLLFSNFVFGQNNKIFRYATDKEIERWKEWVEKYDKNDDTPIYMNNKTRVINLEDLEKLFFKIDREDLGTRQLFQIFYRKFIDIDKVPIILQQIKSGGTIDLNYLTLFESIFNLEPYIETLPNSEKKYFIEKRNELGYTEKEEYDFIQDRLIRYLYSHKLKQLGVKAIIIDDGSYIKTLYEQK